MEHASSNYTTTTSISMYWQLEQIFRYIIFLLNDSMHVIWYISGQKYEIYVSYSIRNICVAVVF